MFRYILAIILAKRSNLVFGCTAPSLDVSVERQWQDKGIFVLRYGDHANKHKLLMWVAFKIFYILAPGSATSASQTHTHQKEVENQLILDWNFNI